MSLQLASGEIGGTAAAVAAAAADADADAADAAAAAARDAHGAATLPTE